MKVTYWFPNPRADENHNHYRKHEHSQSLGRYSCAVVTNHTSRDTFLGFSYRSLPQTFSQALSEHYVFINYFHFKDTEEFFCIRALFHC